MNKLQRERIMGDSDGVVRKSISLETGGEERGPAYIKDLR